MIDNESAREDFTYFARHPDDENDDMSRSGKGMLTVILNHFLKAPRVEMPDKNGHIINEVDKPVEESVIKNQNSSEAVWSEAASTSQSENSFQKSKCS